MDDLTRAALAARSGDATALDRFVRLSHADVWRMCRWLSSTDEADDLAQETYLRAMKSLHTFRADSGARSWLLAIARNTCADGVARRQRLRLIDERATDIARRIESAPDHADAFALDDLVAALPDDRRVAFVLTQLLGASYEEAAEIVGCPVGTIKSRVARARLDLHQSMQGTATQLGS